MSTDPLLDELLPGFTLSPAPALTEREAAILTALHYHRAVDVANHYDVPASSLYALQQKHLLAPLGDVDSIAPAKPKSSGPMADAIATDIRILLARGLTPADVAARLGISTTTVQRHGGALAHLEAGYRQDQRTRGARA